MNLIAKVMNSPLFDAYDSDQKDIIEYTLISLGIGLLFAFINSHLLFPAFIITSTLIKPKFLARNRADIVDGKIVMANGKLRCLLSAGRLVGHGARKRRGAHLPSLPFG